MTDDKLTPKEVARELGYHRDHIYRLLREGKLTGERMLDRWLIDRDEVNRIKREQGDGGRLPRDD